MLKATNVLNPLMQYLNTIFIICAIDIFFYSKSLFIFIEQRFETFYTIITFLM